MAYSLTIPFYLFRLRFHPGVSFLVPMNDLGVFFLNQSMEQVAERYGSRFQEKVLQKGNFKPLLEQFRSGEFHKDTLEVSFPAAKDQWTYPAFSLDFDFFYHHTNGSYWGVIPALGVEAIAPDLESLGARLTESTRLEFTTQQRLQAVQGILSAIWMEAEELLLQELPLQFPTPTELHSAQNREKSQWLPRLATLLGEDVSPAFGREEQLRQMVQTLKGAFHRNLLLVGPSGVGKTALVWEMARRKQEEGLQSAIWETTASALLKELTQQTGWEDNIIHLCRELKEQQAVLFVRNLMELFEVGKYIGNETSIAEYLLPFINRGEISLVSECSEEEKAQIELRSPNYLAAFQVIRIEEPSPEALESIIRKKVEFLAAKQPVQLEEDAIVEAINLHKRFAPYSGMPGKPIRFLESLLVNTQPKTEEPFLLNRETIIRYFCQETGMPPAMVDPSIPFDSKEVERFFQENIFGQERAIQSILRMLVTVKTALNPTGKPIASFLFAGPTGVGKTELAKVLAEYMFGSRHRMIRFDMSEFGSSYDVLRLTGVSYQSDGLLTSAVRREPFCVLLFDEIEKADSDFYDLLLQILGEGRLTDSRGQVVNFCSAVIIMTSNIGAQNLQTHKIGMKSTLDAQDVVQHFTSAVERHFRPELFNRIDQVIPFEPLPADIVRKVVDRELKLFRSREGILFRKLFLEILPPVYDFLGQKGNHPLYGARYLQRTIRKLLVIPLSQRLNNHDYTDQLIVSVDVEGDGLSFSVQSDPLGMDLLLEELEKIHQADHASQLRRSISRLQHGHFFTRMLSELDILEREQREKGAPFWKQQGKVAQYTRSVETRKQLEELQARIEQLEVDLSLACLGTGRYNTAADAHLQAWESDFNLLREDLYRQIHPQTDQCHFQLLGAMPRTVMTFYFRLFKTLGLRISGKTLWFRESYYNQQIVSEAEDKKGKSGKKRKRKAYIQQPFQTENWEGNFVPPKTGDQLFGVEWELSGPCVYLRLKSESGGQRWRGFDQPDLFAVIKITEKETDTPENIHRQEFYKEHPARRVVEPLHFKDRKYKIDRDLGKDELAPFLLKYLEKQLMKKIDSELI